MDLTIAFCKSALIHGNVEKPWTKILYAKKSLQKTSFGAREVSAFEAKSIRLEAQYKKQSII